MPDWGLKESGFIAPRAADFLTILNETFVEELAAEGVSITLEDVERDTVLGNFFAVDAQALGDLSEALQMAVDGFDPNNAQGMMLENIGLITGVPKNPVTYSTVPVQLTGTVGTFLSKGEFQVRGGGTDGRAVWEIAADTTLTATTQIATFQCTVKGEVTALAGEVDEIVTTIDGITAVENLTAATPGREEETNAAFKLRRQESLQIGGGGSTASIQANLLAIDGVLGAKVVENPNPDPETIEGITVNGNSIAAILYPSTMTDEIKQQVAETIYLLVYNTNTTGTDVVATVTGADDQEKTISFDFATEVTVDVAFSLTMASGYDSTDVEDEIQDAVDTYFDGLNLGDDVRILKLYAAIGEIEGIEDATITIEGVEDSYSITAVQIAVLGTLTIEEA